MKIKILIVLGLILSLTATCELQATTFKVLADFVPAPQGSDPSELVLAQDGNYYGTTALGGNSGMGTFFRMSPARKITTILSFTATTGGYPTSLVAGIDGNLYGVTGFGGTDNAGTIFRISLAGELTTLATFAGTDSSHPYFLMQAKDGNFYGSTLSGGGGPEIHGGSLFKMTPSGQLTTLVPFSGFFETGKFIQGKDGNFYGTPAVSVSGNKGLIFKVTLAGTKTTLVSFNGTNGNQPVSGLIQAANGNFYGITRTGGAQNCGTFFRMTVNGGLTIIKSFTPNEIKGGILAFVLGRDGNIYGTTAASTTVGSQIFKLTQTGEFSTFTTFPSASPAGSLTQDNQGNFYNVNGGGGASQNGSICKVSAAGTVTPLVSFAWGKFGKDPSSVVQGADGYLYGTTRQGGSYGGGTFFKISPQEGLVTLASFTPTTGEAPTPRLVQGSDGSFYGTTETEGPGKFGTLFRVTPAGTITRLAAFNGKNGTTPQNGVIRGTDDNFYGTTRDTVFKVTPTGGLTTLARLNPNLDGHFTSGLLKSRDGNFYGTIRGAAYPRGDSIFKITPAGVLSTVCDFNQIVLHPIDGVNLVEDSSGNILGLTDSPIFWGSTNIFKLSPSHFLSPLGTDIVAADLISGSDGNFYGTAAPSYGSTVSSLFRLTPKGVFTKLLQPDFLPPYPGLANLVQGHDGNFYGTAGGGEGQSGVIFGLTLKALTQQTLSFPAIGTVISGQTLTLNATASSGLPLTFRVVSGPATVAGNQLTITGVGLVKVAANQAGNLTYAEKEVSQNVQVRK